MSFNFNSGMLDGLSAFKAKRDKMSIKSFILLLVLGVAFIVGGIFLFNSMKVDESWVRTQGEVVGSKSRISDGSTMYTAIVSYKVDNKTYQVASRGGSSLAPNVGDTKEVAYDPAQPNVATVEESAGTLALILIFPVVGAIILILVPLFFVKSLKRSNRIKQLVQNGRKLDGVLVDTSRNTNGGAVVITVAAVDANGETRNYVSDPIAGAAGLALADFRNEPIPINVYIDPLNPADYYVDISDIPNLTPQRIGELLKKAVHKNNPTSPQPIMNAQPAAMPVAASPAAPVMPAAAPVEPVVQPTSAPAMPTAQPAAAPFIPQTAPPINNTVVQAESPTIQPYYAEPSTPVQPDTTELQIPPRDTTQPPAPRV